MSKESQVINALSVMLADAYQIISASDLTDEKYLDLMIDTMDLADPYFNDEDWEDWASKLDKVQDD